MSKYNNLTKEQCRQKMLELDFVENEQYSNYIKSTYDDGDCVLQTE